MEVVSILIALLGVTFSLIALVRTRVSEDRRRKLELATHLQEYYGGIRDWSEQVIEKLTDAVFLCELDPQRMEYGQFFERRRQMRADLSSLLDKGRLYMPNTNQDVVGLWKPGAYRGLRQAALSWLDHGYKLVERLNYERREPNKSIRQRTVDVKREFTSEIQDVLDIRKTSSEIRRLAKEIRSADTGNGTAEQGASADGQAAASLVCG